MEQKNKVESKQGRIKEKLSGPREKCVRLERWMTGWLDECFSGTRDCGVEAGTLKYKGITN